MTSRHENVRAALKRKLRKLEIQYEKIPENSTIKRGKLMKMAEKLEKQINSIKD